MKAFEFWSPVSLDEASELLTRESPGGAMLLAGGQDLLTELKEHLAEPDRLVNLKKVPGLDRLEWGADGSLVAGALVTIETLARDSRVQSELTLLAEAAESVASPQIRSMGTLGGNLNQRPRCWYYRSEHAPCLKKGGTECYSFAGKNKYNAILGGGPSYIVHPSDLAPALVALGAEVVLRGRAEERVLPLERYYTLPSEADVTRETVLRPGEILTHVRVPAPRKGLRSTYLKFKERGSFDFALAAVALAVWIDAGEVSDARLVLGGVAPVPWRVPAAERALVGREPDAAAARAAAEEALKGAEPLSENGYKIPLTQGLVRRALEKLS